MIRRLVPVLAGLLLSSALAEPITLRTAAQINSIPKYDPTNPAAPGICVDIMLAIEKIDPQVHFTGQDKGTPIARIEYELEAGNLDVFLGFLSLPERRAKYNYVDIELYAVKHKVAVRAEDKVDIKNLDDLKKYEADGVMVTQGTGYVTFLQGKGIKVDAGTNNDSDIFKKLLSGRGRFFYQSDLTLRGYIKKDKLEDKVRILPADLKSEGQFMAFGKAVPAATVARVKDDLEKLQKSGELSKILDKYLQ